MNGDIGCQERYERLHRLLNTQKKIIQLRLMPAPSKKADA